MLTIKDSVLDAITALEKQLNNAILCQAQQKKLTDFFQPQ